MPRAQVVSFHHFRRFHEQLNRTLKLCVCSLSHADHSIPPSGADSREFWEQFIARPGEPWGVRQRWPRWSVELDQASVFLAEMAIVRVDSAFDHFLTSLQAEHERHLPGTISAVVSDNDTPRPLRICERRGMSTEPIREFVLIWKLFEHARNCIAHRNGQMTHGVIEMLGQADVRAAVENWPTRRGAPKPTLPLIENGRIKLRPRDALVYSDACYKIASHLNDETLKLLSDDELIWMAAHTALFAEAPLIVEPPVSKSLTAAIKNALGARLNAQALTIRNVAQSLKDQGRWAACLKRFAELSKR